MKKIIFVFIILVSISFDSYAQKVTLGTNALSWMNFGTINLDLGVALSRHFSFSAGAKYNPWEFDSDNPHLVVQNKTQTYYAGFRYWPWYIFSGWWMEAKAQYQDYSRSGIWRPALEIGKGIGGGFSVGYTRMISKSLNMEFGAGLWGGRLLDRVLYDCPMCHNVREKGSMNFITLDNVSISIFYIF